MSTLDLQNIDVLNYGDSKVFLETSSGHYRINEAKGSGTPALITLPISELKYIASNTEVFNIGILTFEEEHKERIFKELRINDWRKILTDDEIENILLKPSLEGLQRLIDIKNPAYFDRVRVILHKLNTDGASVTARVVDVVNRRYYELANRLRNSKIQLVEKDTKPAVAQEDVDAIRAQNEALQAQMAEMQRMMQEMIASQASQASNAETHESAEAEKEKESDEPTESAEESAVTTEKKQRGRPPKNANASK